MAYPAETPAEVRGHKLLLEDRSSLTVTGVIDVESFDETLMVLVTGRGVLVVRGSGLHLQQLSLEGGQAAISGTVDSLLYEEDGKKGGFFSRLLG